ncbi:MAG: 2-oxo acid dehydrogenase subunit E2, partial [Saprospiraceae bacterium]|nr:2-oxo acid dehydrogenase subunit E2 [Saprospiraceae bacterium]
MSLVEMKVPVIGESVNEVTLSQWLKENGDYVELDEPICEFESDKATLEFPAEASGKLIYVAEQGADLPIGALVAKIDTTAENPAGSNGSASAETKETKPTEEKPAPKPEAGTDSYAKGHPSPAAAKILDERGIKASEVAATGKDGRITKEDALKATEKTKEAVVESKEKSTPVPTVAFSRVERKEKMSRMRRTIAARLVSAKNNTAMLTTFNEVDMTGILDLRKKYQDQFVAKHGIKLGFMSLFAKACAQVLQEMPQVNAQIDGDDLIYHDYVD